MLCREGAVVVTGRFDFPNQRNNVLTFPGVFKGALSVRARDITEGMKIAAANAIVEIMGTSELSADKILPDPFDVCVVFAVAAAVAKELVDSEIAGIRSLLEKE